MLQHFHLLERIRRHGNQVGILARLQRAHILRPVDQVGGACVAARIAPAGVIPYFTM